MLRPNAPRPEPERPDWFKCFKRAPPNYSQGGVDGLVFVSEKGQPLIRHNRKRWQGVCAEVALPWHPPPPQSSLTLPEQPAQGQFGRGNDIAEFELYQRQHARVEDRIRNGKDRGLRNLPCQDLHTNAAWIELALTAADLTTWAQVLCFTGTLRKAEPKRLCYQALHVAGRLVRTGRRLILRLTRTGHGPPTWPPRSTGSALHPGPAEANPHPSAHHQHPRNTPTQLASQPGQPHAPYQPDPTRRHQNRANQRSQRRHETCGLSTRWCPRRRRATSPPCSHPPTGLHACASLCGRSDTSALAINRIAARHRVHWKERDPREQV